MVKILITTIQVNFVLHHSLSEGRTLFLQLGCFGLDYPTVLLTINFQNGVTIFKIQNSVIHCAIAMKFSGGTTQPMH